MAKTQGIYFTDETLQRAREEAEKQGMKLSPYLGRILEDFFQGKTPELPKPDSDTPLEDLIRNWNPGFGKAVKRWAAKHRIKQEEFMANIVWEICQAAVEDRDPHRFLREDFPAAAEDPSHYASKGTRHAG